jgi:peptide/nickel transport system substrate-binding protein
LDGLTVRFIRQAEVELALSEGQFDALGALPAIVSVSNLGSFTDVAYPAPQVIYIAINFDPRNEAPLPSKVREALLLALDREAILSEVLAGDGQLMAASLLPSHWAAHKALSPPAYDPAAARSLLAQANLVDSDGDGWLDQNGERVEIFIRLNGSNKLHQRIGWLASSYYRDLGLFSRSDSAPPDSLIDDLFTHDFNLAIFSWLILPDPDQRLYWHSAENTEGEGLNFGSYNNPQLDNLLDSGLAIPGCQPEARSDIYAQIQDILSQERPTDFLIAPNRHVFVGQRLQGLQPGPFAPFTWNVTAWHLQ